MKIRLLPLAVLLVALYLMAEVGTGMYQSYSAAPQGTQAASR